MGVRIDMTGKQCGKFTVLAAAGKLGAQAAWKCRCSCGHEVVLRGNSLRVARPNFGCQKCMQTDHGHAKRGALSSEYSIWCGIKGRCNNPSNTVYKFYGARGIKICERWADSFEVFLSDMGNRPSKRHSIDRFPNQNGNYEPSNCRWATRKEQHRNMRNNKFVIYRGIRMLLLDAHEHSKSTVPYHSVLNRINLGWAIERALSQPKRV